MAADLGKLTVDDFTPLVGETFVLDVVEGPRLEFTLTASSAAPPAVTASYPEGLRPPFSLTFRGPAEPILAQQICPLVHESLGRVDLFLVPRGASPDGVDYEVSFG